MKTGRVFAANANEIVIVAIAYTVRVVTLPLAVIADWVAMPVLRMIDRSDNSWWVVEVRFHGWDAEFVRVAEAASQAEAEARLAEIKRA